MLEEGKKWKEEKVAEEKDSAISMKSGTLPVFSTPSMIALMEYTAWRSIADELPEGQTSVGIEIHVNHQKGTLIGKTVSAVSTLKKIDGKKLFFEIEVFSDETLIGKGEHCRFLVDENRFMEKLSDESKK